MSSSEDLGERGAGGSKSPEPPECGCDPTVPPTATGSTVGPSQATPASTANDSAADSDRPPGDVTKALRGRESLDASTQRSAADAQLLALVHDQLHAIARRRMAGERAAHTMQATALVNEVYMKMMADGRGGWGDRSQFFRAAAEAMRRILIDHARRRGSAKRGSGKAPMPIDVVDLAAEHDPSEILALDEAMQRLESEDARAAEIVRLRFYAGLEVDEVAELTGLSPRTVARDWAFARARLYELLEGG